MTESESLSTEARRVTRAAVLISIGSIASRALGLVSEMAKARFFGAGGAVSAFEVASQVPTMLHDQLMGGMLSSALVPVFSDYARAEEKEELWQVLGHVFTIAVIVLTVVVLLLEFAAPQVARLFSSDLPPEYLAMASDMVRITAPAVIFLNLAALFTGTLHALQRFRLPAFTGTVHNATMVMVIILLGSGPMGTRTLAIGLLAATMAQVVFQLPGLRGVRFRIQSPFPLHPALVQIGKLYLPIGVGLLADQFARALSLNLASATGPSGIAWMNYATKLIQFPLGLVVTAVSVAILPTLSRYATDADEPAFRTTLAQGLRLVLILVLPAAFGLLVIAEPLVALILQRGAFQPSDTLVTAQVLRFSILGLIFAALDTPLIFAFYARKDTWTPALVGMGTTAIYILMALAPTWFHEPRLWELVFANSLKLAAHALLMLYLFSRKVGSLMPYGLGRTAAVALGSSVAMALPVWGILQWLEPLVPVGSLGYFIRIVAAVSVGGGVYLGLLALLGVEELTLIRLAVRPRLAAGARPLVRVRRQ